MVKTGAMDGKCLENSMGGSLACRPLLGFASTGAESLELGTVVVYGDAAIALGIGILREIRVFGGVSRARVESYGDRTCDGWVNTSSLRVAEGFARC